MSPELAEFARERDRRREGRFENGKPVQSPDLSAYVSYLNQQTVERLGFDLTDPNRQFDFPHLARLIRLEQVQKKLNADKARKEWVQLADVLGAKELNDTDRAWFQAFRWVAFCPRRLFVRF
jgi:hypothetical protein